MGWLSQLLKRGHKDDKEVADSAPDAELKADVTLCAPVTGTLLPLEEVPDIVISEKVMGKGVAVVPESETIVAPCDGVISRLLPTNNAFVVTMANGLEIYVTFGVEAMELKGVGFTVKVNLGDEVKKGDPVLVTEPRVLNERLKSSITSMIVIKSSGNIAKVTAATGKCQAGISPVLWIALNEEPKQA